MTHPDYARAARHVTAHAVTDTLVEMVNIASPTGREGALAEYIVARLAKAGFQSYLQEVSPGRPNAVGVRPGTGDGTNLLFTGHMDTSYDGDEEYLQGDGFKARAVVRDGWIWGLGANNMKSGLASALVALEAIHREGIALKGDLLYGGVVGETEKAPIDEFRGDSTSGYGVGTRYMVLHGITADCAILCEPTNNRVCTANMGAIWAKITVAGTVSHAANSRHPSVVNAIREMHALQGDIEKWIAAYEAAHVCLGEHPNVTIAAIRGGLPWRLARNPFECSLYLDIRTVPGQTAEQVKRSLREVLRKFAAARNKPEPRLEFFVTDPPTEVAEDALLARALSESHRRVVGQPSPYIIRRTGADSTHLNRYDVECIAYGPGGRTHPDAKGLMHAVGEHASVENLVTAAHVYLDVALTLCSQSAPVPAVR
ncbi:MAG TPA: M20/M25/M40 family metallo-hydrolase [Burkholderiales bacterium]|nr:M20/M25/M40 family metallo-hydrolase [Burkholderiales bacterium]